jgi:transposase InsO family protein
LALMVLVPPALSREQACELLGLARSYYYALLRPTPSARAAGVRLRDRIEAICLEFPRYGYRRVTAQLQREGFLVNHKRVQRIMQEENLRCQVPQRFIRTTNSNHGYRRFPNLLRRLTGDRLNQVWVADFTYIRLPEQCVYLAVLLDSSSRRVSGWDLSSSPTAAMCVRALRQALTARDPATGFIHHSDQGVESASTEYVGLLQERGARRSMSRVGNPYDNARMESFIKTLKHEEVYLVEDRNEQHARERSEQFLMTVYNQKRLHSPSATDPLTSSKTSNPRPNHRYSVSAPLGSLQIPGVSASRPLFLLEKCGSNSPASPLFNGAVDGGLRIHCHKSRRGARLRLERRGNVVSGAHR